jgi:gliding motility-associated-like protein
VLRWIVASGACVEDTNTVTVVVNPAALGSFAVAPADICPNSRTLPLGATVSSGTGIWSSTGQGGFTDPTNPNARYVADSLDSGTTIDLIWTVSSGGCGAVQYTQPLTIQLAPLGSINNVPPAICAGDTTIMLNAAVQSGTGRWATPNGAGSFIDSNNPNTRYVSVSGDANQVILLWWIVENSSCVSDTSQVTMFVGQPPLGSFPTAPASVCIGGTTAPLGATLSQGTGFWSTSGTGVFTNPSSPNSLYIANEAGEDSVLLTWVVISGNCAPEVYSQRMYVYADPLGSFTTVLDTICSGGTTVPLNGIATVGTGRWATPNGLGTFVPNVFAANARYRSDTSDANQNILLHWIVTNGPCTPDTITQSVFVRSDRVFGTFSTPPPDICANEYSQPLGATVVYGTGQWFTPDGTGFFEDVADPNTRYRPGPGVNDRTITLVWRITNGSCAALELAQPLSIFVEPQGIFPLGPDPICVGAATGPLNAATLQGVGEWRAVNGAGSFVPNAQSPTARYASVAADAGKTLTMEWIITNGVCQPDTLRHPLEVNTPPAGSFTTNIPNICAGSPTIALNANISSGLVEWSSPNCDGTFSPPTSANAIYNSVLTDAGKSCILRLRIFNPGCTDTVMTRNVTVLNTIIAGTFTPAPAPVCIGDTTAPLGATVTSGIGTWQTSGSGIFIPNTTNPNARYVPGASDAGTTVTLTWQITNGLCNALLRQQPLVVSANPVGSIQSVSTTLCFPSVSDTLRASATVGTGRWDTDGDGAINVVSPTQAIYVPAVADLGSVVNMFWITESGVCKADTQAIALTYDTPPAGSFVTNLPPVCAGSQTPPLGATLQLGIGRWESSSGRGTFLNVNAPNTIYISDTLDAGDTIRLRWIISNGSTCIEDTNRRQLVVLGTKIEGAFNTVLAPVCQGTLTQPLGATVSIGRGSWSTSGNGVFLPNDTTPNAQYLPIGDAGSTVNLCWTIQDDLGLCAVRQLCQPLIVNPAPAGSQLNVPVSAICIGDSTEPYQATVSFGEGFWSCLNCSGTFTQPDSLSTRYVSGPADTGVVVTIRWSVTNLGCDTVHYDRQLVVFNTSLGAFATAPDTICAGDASQPLGAETIRGIGQWNCSNCNGGFTAPTSNPNARYISVQADSAQDVVLSWIVRNGVCDSVVYQQTLHVLAPSLGAFNTAIAPVCEGQASAPLNSVAINGTGVWSTNGTGTFSDLTSATATYTPGVGDGGTSIQLTWTVTNGVCNPVSYSRNMTVFAPSGGFFPSLQPDSICVGDSTVRLAAGTVFGVGSWSTPNGTGSFTNATDPNARYVSSALDANNAVVLRWTVVNGTCAPISYEDTVFVVGARVVNAGSDRVLCIGDTLQLSASGTDFFVWSPAATLDNPNSPTPRAFPDVTTTYTVTGFDNVLNCVTIDTIRVDVITGTPIQISSNDASDPENPRICEGAAVRLIVSGAVSGYRWEPSIGLDDSTAASPIARPTETTTYRLVARTPNGCISPEAQITVRVDAFPQPVFTSSTLCIGAGYEIPVLNTANCNESEVYNADAQTVQLVAQQTGYGPAHPNYVTDRDTIVILANDLGVLTYSYRCRNATTGCESFTEASFTIVDIPNVIVTANRYVVPYAEADTNAGIVNRQVRFTTTSPDSISFYYWEFNDPSSDTNIVINNPNPTHIFTGPGNYTVVLFVENEFGCPQLQVLNNFVTVLAEDFVFPTAFTPNADGLNDVFQALPAQTARVQRFEIYDRWGQRVFLGNDNRGWDGTDGSGRQLDPGLYTYRVLIEMDTRGSQLFTGYVTLIR